MKKRFYFKFCVLCLMFPAGIWGEEKGYVPPPQPVVSDYEIIAFYYPGTEQREEWEIVRRTLPEIQPLLGWYDEGNPEVIDWQIKWSVENGISAYFVDWYWNQGRQRLDHWIKGYYQARYRSHLPWALMWANHNEVGAHDWEDMQRVTKFWIENYFQTPEYYTIDKKPVVLIWEPQNIDRDLIAEAKKRGEDWQPGEGLRQALDLSRKMAREAGLPGIHFIAMNVGSANEEATKKRLTEYAQAGINELTHYNYWWQAFGRCKEKSPEDTRQRFSFDCVVKTVPTWWKEELERGILPVIPTLPTGWNDIPRSFDKARVIYGRTPEKFRKICEQMKAFAEEKGIRRIVIAPINEWQEGSYIEPNREYGFAMLEAIRDTFCQPGEKGWPKNQSPQELGLGPYDDPEITLSEKCVWNFDTTPEGWYRQPYGTGEVWVEDGMLKFIRTQPDRTAIQTYFSPFSAQRYRGVSIRMKITPNAAHTLKGNERSQIFWSRTDSPIFDTNFVIRTVQSTSIEVQPDGEFHVYFYSLRDLPEWNGFINGFWIDPFPKKDAAVEIDWIRLEK